MNVCMKIAFFANVAFCMKLNKRAKLQKIEIDWRVDTDGNTETKTAYKLKVPSKPMKIFANKWSTCHNTNCNFVITPISETRVRLGLDTTKYVLLKQPGVVHPRTFGIKNKKTNKKLYYQFDTVSETSFLLEAYGFMGLERRITGLNLPFTFTDSDFTEADMLLEAILAEGREFNAEELRNLPIPGCYTPGSGSGTGPVPVPASYNFSLNALKPEGWQSARGALEALERELQDLRKFEHTNWEELKQEENEMKNIQ